MMADPLSVLGELLENSPGWAEVYGDDGEGPEVFQGATEVGNETQFSHQLPVLDLVADKNASTEPDVAEIFFATVDPGSHVATLTHKAREETSETSNLVASSSQGLVFDLVRGDVANLAPDPGGGVNLGPVVCLASGITGADLPVVDPDRPRPGEAFFYVARRRAPDSNQAGTYDPAVCWMDSGSFHGPRRPSEGDCGL
jgi:hypothetical protein